MSERPLVTRPPKIPKPLPQADGPGEATLARGEDAAPMRWAGSGRCGHRIPARVGPPLVATFIDPADPPTVGPASFVVVDAEPGECPVCDDAARMAVRDAD